jgi:hypothetical protein
MNIVYWPFFVVEQYRFGQISFIVPTTHIFNSSCLCFPDIFSALAEEYGNENRKKQMLRTTQSRSDWFTSRSIEVSFEWWNRYGIRRCRSCSFGINTFLFYFQFY